MDKFHIEKKIYYHDTDCGGVVYYANYLKYFEEARTEYFSYNKLNLVELQNSGVYFVVKHVDIDYRLPARYQDTVKISAEVVNVGTSGIKFAQKVLRDDVILAETVVTLVCVNDKLKPVRLSEAIKNKL